MRFNKVKNILNEQKIIILIVFLSIFFSLRIQNFLGFGNLIQLFTRISIEGIIIIGMTYLIILGEIDLSVGQIMSLSGFFSVYFQNYGVVPGILMGILVGTVIGYINGFIVVKLKIASIASTIGMAVLLNGVVYVLTMSDSIAGENPNFQLIADSKLFKIPIIVLLLFILLIIFEVILKRTLFGRNVYASGGNPLAAKLAKINVDRLRIIGFIMTGFFSGLAGVLLVSKFKVTSGLIGQNTPLFVITAVLLGGVSLSGGEGSVWKAFQGLLLIGIIENFMINIGAHAAYKFMVMGFLLILILSIDGVIVRKNRFL